MNSVTHSLRGAQSPPSLSAVLELFKQGLVNLHQPERFGDIEVIWEGGDVAEAIALADAYDG